MQNLTTFITTMLLYFNLKPALVHMQIKCNYIPTSALPVLPIMHKGYCQQFYGRISSFDFGAYVHKAK